jgi:hypothetical protein
VVGGIDELEGNTRKEQHEFEIDNNTISKEVNAM